MRLAPALLLLVLALTGCALKDVETVRSPFRSPIVGKYFPDVATCMGPWDSAVKVTTDSAMVTWKHAATAAAIQITVPVFGSLTAGSGGGCMASALVARDGLVENFGFPGSYSTALLSAPYQECEPLIHECVHFQNDTGKPVDYDLFAILNITAVTPAKKPEAEQ